jgi:hypothetical protein
MAETTADSGVLHAGWIVVLIVMGLAIGAGIALGRKCVREFKRGIKDDNSPPAP